MVATLGPDVNAVAQAYLTGVQHGNAAATAAPPPPAAPPATPATT